MAETRLPAFMIRHPSFRGRDLRDIEIPRLKLLQATSPELKDLSSVKAGDFWHCLAEEALGSTVRVCPIYIDSRFILWRPLAAGGGILACAADGKHWMPADADFAVKLQHGQDVTWRTARTVRASRLDRRGSSDPSDPTSPPAAQRIYSIVCAFPDRQDLPPAVVILQGAALKVAIKLIGELKALRAPTFGVILELASFPESSSSGGAYTYTFNITAPVEDRALYEENCTQYRFFLEHGLKIKDLEGAQEENASSVTA